MDGLAFYRLTQLPQKKSQKRKVQTQQVVNQEGVEYICTNCHTTNLVSAIGAIQCRSCDWRILEKGRSLSVTLSAV